MTDSASASTTVSRSVISRRPIGHRRRQGARQPRIDLHSDNTGADLEQTKGQRAQSGSDLQDDVLSADARGDDDPPYGVGVGDEVLPALLGGP